MTSTLTDFEHFFKLSDPFGTRALRLKPADDSGWLDFETAIGLATGRLVETKEPLHLAGHSGRRPMDFLWTASPPLLCVSQRVVDLLATNQLTGWSTYPVTVSDRDNNPLAGYFGFAVTGAGGKFNPQLSRRMNVDNPWGPQRDIFKGYFFNPEDWDGSDFFTSLVPESLRRELCVYLGGKGSATSCLRP